MVTEFARNYILITVGFTEFIFSSIGNLCQKNRFLTGAMQKFFLWGCCGGKYFQVFLGSFRFLRQFQVFSDLLGLVQACFVLSMSKISFYYFFRDFLPVWCNKKMSVRYGLLKKLYFKVYTVALKIVMMYSALIWRLRQTKFENHIRNSQQIFIQECFRLYKSFPSALLLHVCFINTNIRMAIKIVNNARQTSKCQSNRKN